MVVLLVLLVPFVILVFLLAMEWLEATLLGPTRARGPGDAKPLGTAERSAAAAADGLDEEPRAPSATRRRQAFAG